MRCLCRDSEPATTSKTFSQKNSRRLWRSRRRKSSSIPAGAANFPAAVSLPESVQTLAGIALHAAGKSGNHFPAASKFAGKPSQQGISDSHSLLEFSDFREIKFDNEVQNYFTNCVNLVAPYCAIRRDYLSHTPLLRAMGLTASQHGQEGAIPPPPFLSVSPLESMRSGGAIPPPPPQKGYLSDRCAIPHENKACGCDTPLCDTVLKRYCAMWGGGGISHWAAKCVKIFWANSLSNVINRMVVFCH